MSSHPTNHRGGLLLAVASQAALLLTLSAAPVLGVDDPERCLVHNVTQDTWRGALEPMVAAADDDDELRVRGACPALNVVIGLGRRLTISGVGDDATLTGLGEQRLLLVKRDATLRLANLTLTGGASQRWGGAIDNRGGQVSLRDSVVRGNRADSVGAIANGGAGQLTLTDTVVLANHADHIGGILNGGTLTVTGSRIAANTTRAHGGGIYNSGPLAWLTLTDSVVAGNHAGRKGGGIWNGGTLVLVGSTVSGNSAGIRGGGIWNVAGSTVTLDGTSSVSGNEPDDCRGTSAC